MARTMRSPGRLAMSMLIALAMVSTACGGRGEDDDRASGSSSETAEAAASGADSETPDEAADAAAPEAVAEVPAAEPSTPEAPAPSSASTAAPSRATAAAPRPATGKTQAPKSGAPGKPAAPPKSDSRAAEPAAGSAAPPPKAGPAPAPALPDPSEDGRHTGPADLSPIHLGTVCECSGPTGASIGAGIASNQLVVKWINDNGGLNGHPVKLFVANSNSDPNQYFGHVKRMVEQEGVIGFVGTMAPLTLNAADKYLREKGIPVVGGDGAHELWFDSPVHFFPGPSYRTLVVATAKYAVSIKKSKIALIYCAEANPCQVARDALHSPLAKEKAPGAEIVYEAKASLAQPDYTAECLQARQSGANAVAFYLDAAATSRATRSCMQQGYNPQWLTSPLTSADAGDPNNDGMMNPVATFPWFSAETPAQKLFHAAVKKYKPDLEISATSSVVWVAGQMLMAASTNLPKENVTPADLMQGIWTIKNNGFEGLTAQPVSFPEGQPSPDLNCYFVIQIEKGEYVQPAGTEPYCL